MNSNALKYILQYIRKSTNSTCSDAMALVRFIRVYGNSDFFITFNVDCREAKAEIEPGQKPYDRPDVLCRVFNQKRNEFLKDKGEYSESTKLMYQLLSFRREELPMLIHQFG